MAYLTVPLDKSHNKRNFRSIESSLNDYLHRQASQDIKRKLAVCFVLDDGQGDIKGYYTLSSGSIPLESVPNEIKRQMPKSYHDLPTTLLGRLAVDVRFGGQGLGESLLLDALKRSLDIAVAKIGSMAVVVDPLHATAAGFYTKYGFINLPGSGKMFLPMKTISTLF
ncbi:MAG: GNAT family N-acetyltransferase [Cyclobacteriaceae bacterium]